MHATVLDVPAVVMAYNLYMKGVDRINLMHKSNATMRKEVPVPMSIFTFLLDASVINCYALYKNITLANESIMLLHKFRREVTEALVAPRLAQLASRMLLEIGNEGGGVLHASVLYTHVLLSSTNSTRYLCFLCRLRGVSEMRTKYACVHCGKGFCVNCSFAYH